jgi:alanyl-tRNA synthetase|tara:strand:- start:135930 stop:138542 length:2613 start_codon:yes stop_codon:yes gene_type:complete
MTAHVIRQKFLDFFKTKGHEIVSSAPMVIKGDPTLMFTNAGMNQFKEYFLGNKAVTNPRITDTQKCLRVSGKHNDLEEVGMDTYHHTMFEMLGNWSFGDYFKKDAIEWAWELLTNVYQIDKKSLYITVFEGDAEEGLERDQEAYDLWSNMVAQDHIIDGNKKDNFWEMGDQGPCGPCSEIHVDLRSDQEKEQISGAELVNKDHPLVIEIWNLVFMQFNRKADRSLEKLPAQHVDTGMGFERLCMVLQGKTSNYDTDVFTPIIAEIESITSHTYGKDHKTDVAMRVIADHVRAVAFSIADGQLPSNSGAGYVIRRILRRAIRYGYTFLAVNEPFMYHLAATLTKMMGEAFPELVREQNLIQNVIREEELSFLRTLDQGLVLLDQVIEQCATKTVSGAKAFELYDTYGFPIDLTALILRERGFDLDHDGFVQALEKQKTRSRAATKIQTGDWVILTDDQAQDFVGFDALQADVHLVKYRKIESKKDGALFQLVFNQTPFYPEGGGQVGDKGYLESSNGEVTYIIDTKKENNLIVHFAKSLPKVLDQGLRAVVEAKQRAHTQANHTATHLLHQALRHVLGTHVTQKGSMVHSGNLRFDFSHFAKMTDDELQQVEAFVNTRIRDGLLLEEHRAMPYDAAIEMGAMALFGEKYGDAVRTIKFGNSIELCGGTHVPNTADIWHFIITSEAAVASGIRRIEAITGQAAKDFFEARAAAYKSVQKLLNQTVDPVAAIEKMQLELTELTKQNQLLVKQKAQGLKGQLKAEVVSINGVNFLATHIDLDAASQKDLAFELGQDIKDLFLIFASQEPNKALLTCYVSKNLVSDRGLNAATIVRELGRFIQGGGGGQPFFATAGGKQPQGLDQALEAAREYLK